MDLVNKLLGNCTAARSLFLLYFAWLICHWIVNSISKDLPPSLVATLLLSPPVALSSFYFENNGITALLISLLMSGTICSCHLTMQAKSISRNNGAMVEAEVYLP